MRAALVALLLAGATDAQEEDPLLVTFVVHLDPIAGPGIEKRHVEERDSLQWLYEFVTGLPPDRAPRVLLESGGDHADHYRKDPRGLDLPRRTRASGLFTFGVHFHTQVRERDGFWRVAPKEARRRVTEDNIAAVDALVAEIWETKDAALVRELMFSHHVEELEIEGVHAHRSEKATGRDWKFRDGKVVSATKTAEVFVVGPDRPTRVDLSKYVGATAVAIRGAGGEESRVEGGSVEIGPEPLILKVR